jgi:hypothetical protein
LVPLAGVEPAWYHYRMILSHVRLPIPPQRQTPDLSGTIVILPVIYALVNHFSKYLAMKAGTTCG